MDISERASLNEGKDDSSDTTIYIVAGVLGGACAIIIVVLIVLFTYVNNISKQLNALRNMVESSNDSGLGDFLPRLEPQSKPHIMSGPPSVRGGDDQPGFLRPNAGRNPQFDPPGGYGRPPPQQQRPVGFGGPVSPAANSGGWGGPGPQRPQRFGY